MVKTPRRQIAEVIVQLLDSQKNTAELAQHIAAYLIAEHRTREFDSLLRDVQVTREANGLIEVSASSAFALDARLKEEIKTLLTASHAGSAKVMIDETEDEAFIGGVRLETVGKRLDLTLRGRLGSLKRAGSINPTQQQA